MPSHVSSIGFDVPDRQVFADRVMDAASRGTSVDVAGGTTAGSIVGGTFWLTARVV